MRVGFGAAQDFSLADVGGPYGSVSQEETLFGCETVHFAFDLAVFLGLLESGVGDIQTAVVSDVLTEGEFTVGIDTGRNFNAVEMINDELGFLLEGGGILFGPPVGEVAVFVVVTALVVEAVGHLVADNHADGTVVGGIIRVHVEERRLQDAGREAYLVGGGVIIGVHRLRGHLPFGRIDFLADFAHVVSHIETAGVHHVGVVALRADRQCTVVAPFVGIADFHREGG